MDSEPTFYADYRLPQRFELQVYGYCVPMRHKFRGITQRSGLIIHGPAGWAEVSPFWDYDVPYSARWLIGGIDAAVNGLPAMRRSAIPVNVTIPAVAPEIAYDIARAGVAKTAKVKIAESGQTLAQDCERLAAVRDALGPRANIRVDANARWSAEYAITAIAQLDQAAAGLEYVEQPCASVTELAHVRRSVSVPIAADESIRRSTDPFQVVAAEAADLVVIKNQPLGGVRAALALAERLGLPAVVSSALESSAGLQAGLRCASALPELPFACGLATAQLLANDVTTAPLLPTDGEIAVRDVNPDNLGEVGISVDSPLRLRWERRLADMWTYLRERGYVSNEAQFTWMDSTAEK